MKAPALNGRSRWLISVLATTLLVSLSVASPTPAGAAETRAQARVDIVVGANGIVDPANDTSLSIIVRADETGLLNAGDLTITLTDDPFTSEEQIRRFVLGESDPVGALVGFIRSPEVPQLESREVPLTLPASLWSDRLDDTITEEGDTVLQPGIFGIEATYVNRGNNDPGLRQLVGRQLVVVVPDVQSLSPAPIAPIVTLTTSASGGLALGPEELEALTVSGGALQVITQAVSTYPATLAIDSRITSSITALGDAAPPDALRWASTLGDLGLAQFGLPWADADPLGSLEIDTLTYARLGEYPWVHGDSISGAQLDTLHSRSASAILLSSDSLPSDRTIVSVGDARVIRVDSLLSQLAADALQAPTLLEAESDIQKAQGIIAYRALGANPETLVFSVGRLPATASAPQIEPVLQRFSSLPVAVSVPVPLTGVPTEILQSVPFIPVPGETLAFQRAVKALWESDVTFATIASDPEGAIGGRWTRYQSLLSSTWITDPTGLAIEWERAQQDSAEFQNSVRVEQGRAITVLSNETSLPVTVINDLGSTVVVTLRVRPTTAILAVEEPLTTLTIEGESSTRVFVPIQSLTNGTVPVEFSLVRADGQEIGTTVVIPVTLRAGWEGVISGALALVVGGTFAFGLIRAIQRRRVEKQSAGEGS